MMYIIIIVVLVVITFYWVKNFSSPQFKPTEQDKLIAPFILSCFSRPSFFFNSQLDLIEQMEALRKEKITNSEFNAKRRLNVEVTLYQLQSEGKITIPNRGVMILTDEFKKELYPFKGSYLKYLEYKFKEEKRSASEFHINLFHKLIFPAITLILTSTAIYFNLQNNKLNSQIEDLIKKQSQDSIFKQQKMQKISDLVLKDSIPNDSTAKK